MNFYQKIYCVLFLYFTQKTAAEKTHFSRQIRTNEDGDKVVFVFGTVLDKGLDQCIQTCKAKKRCRFINYLVRAHKCFLIGIYSGENASLGNSIEKKPGHIFGNKSEWIMEKYMQCEECKNHGVCSMSQDRVSDMCENSGCPVPEENTEVSILGNMFTVGDKIAYKCDDSFDLNKIDTMTSTCRENGTWSQKNVACFPEDVLKARGIFYKVVKNKMTWDEAKTNCETLGGYLSDIKSTQEQESIEQLVSVVTKTRNIWLGGRKTQDGASTFIWLDNTTVSNGYDNWNIDRPFSGDKIRCIRMAHKQNFRWHDASCNTTSASVCKFR